MTILKFYIAYCTAEIIQRDSDINFCIKFKKKYRSIISPVCMGVKHGPSHGDRKLDRGNLKIGC